MSVTDFTIFDPGSGLASRTAAISPAPLTLLGPFNFAFDTPGLTTGVTLVTLPLGAVIYDVGVSISVAFDGTTPKADVGTFSSTAGLFDELAGAAVDLSAADDAVTDNDPLTISHGSNWLAAAIGSVGAAGSAAYLPGALYCTDVSTVKLVVSQDGSKGGTAIGGTAGTGAVYVLAATPYTS